MAKTLVKNPICSKCGEEARPQAQFCFACGGKILDPDEKRGNDVSSAWFREEIVEHRQETQDSGSAAGGTKGKKASEPDSEIVEDEDAKLSGTNKVQRKKDADRDDAKLSGTNKVQRKKDADRDDAVAAEEDADVEAEEKKENVFRSAAELRRRPKPIRKKQVEVVWTENTESANLPFLVFGLILVCVAAVLIFFAFYLK